VQGEGNEFLKPDFSASIMERSKYKNINDDDAFEAEPATKPLDVSQHVLLTEPPDKIYAQYGFPILHFLTSDPPFFESACRGVHHGFPALGA
jgi:hypothetical protein